MSRRAIGIIIAALLSVMVIFWVGWLFITNRLVYHGSSIGVCDSVVVDTYNDAMYYKLRNDSDEPSLDKSGIKSLVAKIKSKPNFKSDPTCQSIVFWSAVADDNYKEAKAAYDAVMSLHKKRIFADSNLRSSQPLFTYEDTLNGLTGSGVSQDGFFGS